MLHKQLFQDLYPKWDSYWRDILADVNKCNSTLKWYWNSSTNLTAFNIAYAETAFCMIGKTEKNIETQTASTGVLLGLLPTILSIMGSNPVELPLLSTHRPLLCFLLVVSVPVVNPVRPFDFVSPGDILKNMMDQGIPPQSGGTSSGGSIIIVALQYLIAIGNVLNVIWMTVDLYGRSWSVVLACTYRYLVFFWSFLVIALWLGGILTLFTRAEFGPLHLYGTPQMTPWPDRFVNALRSWPKKDISVCEEHEEQYFSWSKENGWFLATSQILTAETVAHIFFGHAIFSSFQFIAPIDSAIIVTRYLASACVSRLLLRFELVGLAQRTTAY